jgi:hypothetical protein
MKILTKFMLVFVSFYLSWQCMRVVNTGNGDLFYFIFWLLFLILGGIGTVAAILF